MNIGLSSTLADVAWQVCSALDRVGVEAVLTGGSAATFYAPEVYQSRDLDFVLFAGPPDAGAEQVLLDLGYRLQGSYYEHKKSPLIVEFPPGPLAVGGELLDRFAVLRRGREVLRVLHPTDCCKDRLAAFFHWNDRGALDQALGVARACRADLDIEELTRWATAEGHTGKLGEFTRALAS